MVNAYFQDQFEHNGHIHVYSPGAGADNPHGTQIIILLFIW